MKAGAPLHPGREGGAGGAPEAGPLMAAAGCGRCALRLSVMERQKQLRRVGVRVSHQIPAEPMHRLQHVVHALIKASVPKTMYKLLDRAEGHHKCWSRATWGNKACDFWYVQTHL